METREDIAAPSAVSQDLSLPLEQLGATIAEHEVWKARLLRCLAGGWAFREDLCVVLPALAAAEAGRRECLEVLAARPDGERGARIRRVIEGGRWSEHLAARWRALKRAPGPDVPTFVRYFVQQCLSFCRDSDTAEAAAFLLGGELVAARLCPALDYALLKAGVQAAPDLERSASHELARALGGIVVEPGPRAAVERALSLYLRLLEDAYQAMRFERMSTAFDRIQARASLEKAEEPAIALYPGVGEIMCEERDDKRGIQFSVERYPGSFETLDPRVVRIPPGKTNNLHKHAHETLFYFISGTGRILVGTTWVPVRPGDAVFAPRWAMHQTHNTGDAELVLLAITDYYLTHRVYVGKYDKI